MMKIPLPYFNKPFHKRFESKSLPVGTFEKLYSDDSFAFLYESLESTGNSGRYSFIGARPFILFKSKKNNIEIDIVNKIHQENGNPVDFLRRLVNGHKNSQPLNIFCGGAVGYIAYDFVRFFEEIPDKNRDELAIPEAFFMFPSELIIFDHLKDTIDIVIYPSDKSARAEELISVINTCPKDTTLNSCKARPAGSFESNLTEENFCAIVKRAKDYILAGDIFQVVLSQRFRFNVETRPIDIYKALRITNPSPYMYYLRLNDLFILGSSPETLVKLYNQKVISRPLAGTRPRGETQAEDKKLEMALRHDKKDLAEHIMLVDLARNDLGRICKYGTVQVTELLEIERYSKVMHIVSNVLGKLMDDKDAFDLLQATFPAGTVSGAPKVRAMEIIDELEPTRRGIYAGAIGYFSFSGDMDLCIAIRTIIIKKRTGYLHCGAGIVADSIPQKEYEETLNKARALKDALRITR